MPHIFRFFRTAVLIGGGSLLVYAQTNSLTLSAGSTTVGGTAVLNLSLNASASSQPAGLQWSLSYPASAITMISATPGGALTTGGKTISCNGSPGVYTCVATGVNSNVIQNGTAATIAVTLSAQATGATVNVTNVLGASLSGSAISITGTGGTITTATLPGIKSLACSPVSIVGGKASTCTVTLNQAAPSNGALVALSDNSTALAVPVSVTVPAGATSASFTATTSSVSVNQSAVVTASLNGTSQTASLTVTASQILVSAMQCAPATILGGTSSACTVTLTQPAPAGGAVVALSGNSAAVSLPASATVPAAATSASIPLSTTSVAADQSVTLTASLGGASTKASIVVAAPPVVSALWCTATRLTAGDASNCTVTLNRAALTSTSVSLSSSTAAVSVPANVTVGAGASAALFTATAGTVTADQTVSVGATLNGASQTASITVISPPILSDLTCAPTTLASAGTSICTVTLNKAASYSGASVALASSSNLLKVPASVSVGSNAITAQFPVTAAILSSSVNVLLTGNLNSTSIVEKISLSAGPAITSLVCLPESLPVGSSTNCIAQTVNIAAPTRVLIATNAPGSVTAPAYVPVPKLATSVTFSITATSPYTGLITVTATVGISVQSETLSIPTSTRPDSVSLVTCDSTAITAGDSTQCSVQLASAAPQGGTTVTLASDNPRVLIPDSVAVPEGASGTSFSLHSRPTDRHEIAHVSVAAGRESGAVKVDIAGIRPAAVSCVPASVAAGGTMTCEVRLNAPLETAVELAVASGSPDLKVPAVVHTRPHQSSFTFQAAAAEAAADQTTIISVAFGGNQAQSSAAIAAANAPVFAVPDAGPARFGAPLEFQVAASDPAGLPVRLSTGDLPNGASFDAVTGKFQWTPDTSQQGAYTLVFTATNANNAAASRTVAVQVDDGTPALTAVLHGATRQPLAACSPGAVAIAAGKWLAAAPAADTTGNSLELNGAKVKVNDAYVPVLSAAPRAVSFLCPALPAGTPLQISVETAHGATNTINITMADFAPGIFSLDGSGSGPGLVAMAGSSLLALPRNPAVDGEPAQPGDELAVIATGLPADPNVWQQLTVKIGDVYAAVDAVQALDGQAGLYAVQFQLPAAVPFGDRVAVALQLPKSDSVWTSNAVSIAAEAARP